MITESGLKGQSVSARGKTTGGSVALWLCGITDIDRVTARIEKQQLLRSKWE